MKEKYKWFKSKKLKENKKKSENPIEVFDEVNKLRLRVFPESRSRLFLTSATPSVGRRSSSLSVV